MNEILDRSPNILKDNKPDTSTNNSIPSNKTENDVQIVEHSNSEISCPIISNDDCSHKEDNDCNNDDNHENHMRKDSHGNNNIDNHLRHVNNHYSNHINDEENSQ